MVLIHITLMIKMLNIFSYQLAILYVFLEKLFTQGIWILIICNCANELNEFFIYIGCYPLSCTSFANIVPYSKLPF